ncbi:MAG TPA: ABC transporter ATP-binding protein [Candidatus Eisenbergiella pullicola]|nr:ABC transporter ATP-binding protein [Candidatus Eisenbergiella pullicola]
MEILKVENLCKTYGTKKNRTDALKGISFSAEKGEFVAITGQSGSGKSTLLHLIGGVDLPTSGHIYVDGKEVFSRSAEQMAIFRRRQVGLVYQFYNLIPVLTAEENILLPLKLDGRKINRKRADELIAALGLADRKSHLPMQLSGGQQQRVSIGRALIHAPALLLADEPTGNLDSKSGQEIVELLKYSNRTYGQTLILVTHDEQIALQADRIIRLFDGRIQSDERLR